MEPEDLSHGTGSDDPDNRPVFSRGAQTATVHESFRPPRDRLLILRENSTAPFAASLPGVTCAESPEIAFG